MRLRKHCRHAQKVNAKCSEALFRSLNGHLRDYSAHFAESNSKWCPEGDRAFPLENSLRTTQSFKWDYMTVAFHFSFCFAVWIRPRGAYVGQRLHACRARKYGEESERDKEAVITQLKIVFWIYWFKYIGTLFHYEHWRCNSDVFT